MKEEKTSREKRRRRRVRNQILAYMVLVFAALLILTGGYFGVSYIIRSMKDYNAKVDQVIEEAESSAAGQSETAEIMEMQSSFAGVEDNEGYTPESSADPLGDLIESLLADMTTEEMAAGMFMVSPETLTGVGTAVKAGDGTKTALAESPVGGIIYAKKNFKSAEQFTQMLSDTKGFSKYRLFAAVKAERGSKVFGLDASPEDAKLTEADKIRQLYDGMAASLAQYGVDMNLAPLAEQKFPAYDTAASGGAECIMVSNEKTDGTPACLSSAVVNDTLRGTLGFNGVVITDYLNEKAVTGSYTPAEAAVAAIQAGADIILEPADYEKAYEGVLQAISDGIITKERIYESVYRIYRMKYKNELPQD